MGPPLRSWRIFLNLLLLPPCLRPPSPAQRFSVYRVTFPKGNSDGVITPSNPIPSKQTVQARLALKMKPGPLTLTRAALLTSSGTAPHAPPSPAIPHLHLPTLPPQEWFLFTLLKWFRLPPTAKLCTPSAWHARPPSPTLGCLIPIHPSGHSSNATSSRKHPLTSVPTPSYTLSVCLHLLV